MPRRRSTLLGFTVVLLAWVMPSSAPASTGPQPVSGHAAAWCADIGPAQSDTGLYKVWALRLSCRRARAILNRWYYDASAPDAGPRGWACRSYSQGAYTSRTYCSSGRKRISYTQYSA